MNSSCILQSMIVGLILRTIFFTSLVQAMEGETLIEKVKQQALAELAANDFDVTKTDFEIGDIIEYDGLKDFWTQEPEFDSTVKQYKERARLPAVTKILCKKQTFLTATEVKGYVSYLEPISSLSVLYGQEWKGETHSIQLAEDESEMWSLKYEKRMIKNKEVAFQVYKRLNNFATKESKIAISWQSDTKDWRPLAIIGVGALAVTTLGAGGYYVLKPKEK